MTEPAGLAALGIYSPCSPFLNTSPFSNLLFYQCPLILIEYSECQSEYSMMGSLFIISGTNIPEHPFLLFEEHIGRLLLSMKAFWKALTKHA